MSERFGPALQEANIRALTPHDEFDHRFDSLMPRSGTLGSRLYFKGAERHLPDADEPADMTGEGYDTQNCTIPDCDAASSDDDSEIDEIMRRDLDPDWPDRPLDDLDFDPYPDSSGQPLDSAPAPKPASAPASVQAPDPAFDAAPVAYVGGFPLRITKGVLKEKRICRHRRIVDRVCCDVERINETTGLSEVVTEDIPIYEYSRHFSHGKRGRKPHRPMHVSIRHMMPIDES
ncbi:MAG TPA: hypothetical protein VLB83_00165 [Candidatus Paceibacterota bacterium]|nr:hypothetical protein [Candidatus Paceibacterota bacterium]